jgi:hypothetical protein
MIDLRCFRAIFLIAVLLIAFFAAINFVLLVMIGPPPNNRFIWRPPWVWDAIQYSDEQVAGLEATYRKTSLRKPFVFYAGTSSAGEGVEPRLLEKYDPCGRRVMGVCGIGGAIDLMADVSEPLLRRHLRPSLAILCIHAVWLQFGREPAQSPATVNSSGPLRLDFWRQIAKCVESYIWLWQNRDYMNYIKYTTLAGLQEAKRNLGLVPPVDPWRAPKRLGWRLHQSPRFLENQLNEFTNTGWFDREQYNRNREAQMAALIELISRFRNLGSEVLIVSMPETTLMRSRVPAEEQQFLRDSIQHHFSSDTPSVLDFRDAVPDDMFADYTHLNAYGREKFSLQLAIAIQNLSPKDGCLLQK